jgi:hypothetical protein
MANVLSEGRVDIVQSTRTQIEISKVNTLASKAKKMGSIKLNKT